MSENFTKGPWQKRGFGIYLPNTQKRVCEVPLSWKTSTEQAAVMDLIAASPDLYEQLVIARECIAYCRRAHKDAQSGDGIPVEVFIDAALRKATGS